MVKTSTIVTYAFVIVLLYTLLANVGVAVLWQLSPATRPIGVDFTVIITFGIVFPALYVAALIGTVMRRRWGPALAAVTAVANAVIGPAFLIAVLLVVLALLEYRNVAYFLKPAERLS